MKTIHNFLNKKHLDDCTPKKTVTFCSLKMFDSRFIMLQLKAKGIME